MESAEANFRVRSEVDIQFLPPGVEDRLFRWLCGDSRWRFVVDKQADGKVLWKSAPADNSVKLQVYFCEIRQWFW